MGVSIEEYRQRIGCFVRVLSSFRVRRNNSNLFQKQSKDFGTTLRVIIRCVDDTTKTQSSHCTAETDSNVFIHLSHLFTSCLRLVYWSSIKIEMSYLFLHLIMHYYGFSHMVGLFSVTWLSLLNKFTRICIYFQFLSHQGSTLERTIRIGSTPTFLYFDLYLYSAYAAH